MTNNTIHKRHYDLADRACMLFDDALATLFTDHKTERPYPGETKREAHLNSSERKDVAGLMRVNHAGEVCAQALYQGQALTAQLHEVREQMEVAAKEEEEHLAWCEQRLKELNSHTSRANFLWYIGSFSIGALAGLAGDKWSLGFVIETEKQVVAHLKNHLAKLPKQDERTQAVLQQMQEDEAKHAEMAHDAGGAALPAPIKFLMSCVSKVMTKISYYL